MTAEVAVLNRSGVALAADSLVTIARPKRPAKTYEANKLFALSKHAPVGVMIFGDAYLMRVPWETIIKVYRRQLGKRRFDTVEEYAENLIDFLAGSNELFPEDSQRAFFSEVSSLFFAHLNQTIDNAVRRHIEEFDGIAEATVKKITSSTIKQTYDRFKKLPIRSTLPKGIDKQIIEEYSDEIGDAIDARLGKKPLTTTAKRQLRNLAAMVFTKDDEIPVANSGLVIAGFGEVELFPVVKAYRFHGVLLQELVYSCKSNECYDGGPGCAVLPFAQRDVADSFLQGIDDYNITVLTRYVARVFGKMTQVLDESLGLPDQEKTAIIQKLKAATKTSLAGFQQSIRDHLHERHIAPLLESVSVLPKEELAVLAEALVNLTSIKRKISRDIETVGGPTDVAVISKGDGFVWIQRKHYFDPKLNHHFMQTYLEK